MFSVVFLLALLAFSVTGAPVEVRDSTITLPMTRRLAFSNVTDLLRHDEARLAAFGEYSTRGRRGADAFPYPTVPLSQVDLGNTMQGYTVRVAVGDPPTDYDLVVDTDTAITWVGAALPYFSSSGVATNVRVAVNYQYGTFQGTIWADTISFSERVTIPWMYIGVASEIQNIAADGVLGIGPTLSGRGALPNSQIIPTVIDRLLEEGTISRPVVGITYGEIGILAYSPGIIDSGCTFLYLAIDAYERYRAATGGTLNPANGLLQISLQQYDELYDLELHVGRITLRLVPNAQIWPRSLNHKINGGDNDIFLIVKSLAAPSGAGYNFVNGYVFLQRFYTVFDSRRRVGFSLTEFTEADTN
ncbi:acid protease [Suillus decipiens]|nr:acid protease [Suillus decipiens]